MKEIIQNELNVKQIVKVKSADRFADYEIKPQLKTLGPKYGKLLGKIRETFATLGEKAATVVNNVKNGGKHVFDLDGEAVEVTEGDLLISTKDKDGYSVVSDRGDTVALCTKLTKSLKEEGLVREIVSKIQTMRKECDFVVTDRITVGYSSSRKLSGVISRHTQDIFDGCLADKVVSTVINPVYKLELDLDKDKLIRVRGGSFVKRWEINGERLYLKLSKSTQSK